MDKLYKIKKTLIVIFFIISAKVNSAQPYQSVFGKNTTSWIIEWANLEYYGYTNFFVLHDTVFNSLIYKEVIANDGGQTLDLIREDTITGKIWLIDLGLSCNTDTTERLVADVSLQLGDTFNIRSTNVYVENPADTLIVVDSVYYVQGQKRIRFTSPASAAPGRLTEPITFIEGIGPNYSLLWVTNCNNYEDTYLLCAYKDSVKADYSNLRYSGDCAPILGAVKNIAADAINILPNPTDNYINITGVTNPKTECIITNAIGQPMGHYYLPENSNIIKLDNWENGYYQVTFYLEGSWLTSRKFVKD